MQMEKIREWGFPAVLLIAWMLAAAYTVSFLVEPQREEPPPAAEEPIVAS